MVFATWNEQPLVLLHRNFRLLDLLRTIKIIMYEEVREKKYCLSSAALFSCNKSVKILKKVFEKD